RRGGSAEDGRQMVSAFPRHLRLGDLKVQRPRGRLRHPPLGQRGAAADVEDRPRCADHGHRIAGSGFGQRPLDSLSMISAEQNELMTRVGPGTPAGMLLRNYWQPVALLEELQGPRPVKAVRLLGEDLVL